jgi:ankyrin repeat protein
MANDETIDDKFLHAVIEYNDSRQIDNTYDDKILKDIQEFINAGANINYQSSNGTTAIVEAAGYGTPELVKLLLAAGANVNLSDGDNTALTKALRFKHPNIEIVIILINAGADTNVNEGKPLSLAIAYHNVEIANILIFAGADVNIGIQEYFFGEYLPRKSSQLILASFLDRAEIVKLLLAVPGININLQNEDGNTALITACMKGNAEIVKLLLAVPGIDINLQNNNKNSALTAAFTKRHIDVVKLLLTVPGIDVNLQNNYENTALFHASTNGYTEIVSLLLAVPGINVNIQCEKSYTALVAASFYGHSDIVKLLLTVPEIDTNLQTIYGRTALMLAIRKNHTNIICMLLIAGADVNLKNEDGKKAIDYAIPQSIISDLLKNPSASLMMGKTNRGVIDIPDNNKTNSIAFDDITDGETVIRIQQFGKDFFYRLESWKEFMYNQLKNYPRDPIKNPANREIVTADQIDIFTAHIVPVVQNAPVVGSKRPRPANLRGGTRRRRKTRKANKRKRLTRRRRI